MQTSDLLARVWIFLVALRRQRQEGLDLLGGLALGPRLVLELTGEIRQCRIVGIGQLGALALELSEHRHGLEQPLYKGVAGPLAARQRVQPAGRKGREPLSLALEAAQVLVELGQ